MRKAFLLLTLALSLGWFQPPAQAQGACDGRSYAVCRNGSKWYNATRRGACSRRGGVAYWCVRSQPDGATNPSQSPQKKNTSPTKTVNSKHVINKGYTLTGYVVAVADGDTITILNNKNQYRVRLHGIDAPESKQPHGTQAKKYLADRVFNKTVTIQSTDVDRYGRTVGWVLVGKANMNHEMVRAGYAWWYRQYAKNDVTLSTLEQQARSARRGLWQDKNPVAPWQWRKQK